MKRWAGLFGTVFLYQRGRVLAVTFLLFFAAIAALGEVPTQTLVLSGLTGRFVHALTAPVVGIRQLMFDGYQRVFPRVRQAQKVAVVVIDEKSLKLEGQWPWPRDKLAVLIDAVAAYQPAAIGLNIYLPEPDQTSPEQVAKHLGVENGFLAKQLAALPSHDVRLSQALESAPTVLAAAGLDFATLSTSKSLRILPVHVLGGDALPYLQRFPFVLASLPQLQAAARGQALISIADVTVVRRVPLVSAVGELIVPSFAMEMLRVASGSKQIDVQLDGHGVSSVTVADMAVNTQSGGDIWLHFAPQAQGSERNISAVDLLGGKISADALTGKVVLIGLTGAGVNDRSPTPLGEQVPGIEIQAQVLESMLDGRFLLRPWWMKWVELGLWLGIGTMVIWKAPRPLQRPVGMGTRRPRNAGWWVTSTGLLSLVTGFWLFWSTGLLFDAASLSVGLAVLLVSLVSTSTLEVERDNRRLAAERQHLREDTARLAGEMEVARRIQLGSLPNAQRAFPGEQRFSIDALVEPAREVGGDLFDFFMIDARRLYFLIGDVSGKGVPASVFMAVTKALTRSFATRLPGGAAEIVSAANVELSRENIETLFVTLIVGVLDVDSGALELVNAGHDAPWRLDADGTAEQITATAVGGGPPLCVVDDFAYVASRIQLKAGDRLCMVTDGITEATNSAGDLYGRARLHAALSGLGAEATSQAIARRVRADVSTFVGEAEPSDDLAILVLQWKGPVTVGPNMH